MHPTLAAFTIAALAAACGPAAAQAEAGGHQTVPVQVTCEHGRPTAVTVLLPEPGIVRIELPADVCTQAQPAPDAAAPAPATPSAPTSTTRPRITI